MDRLEALERIGVVIGSIRNFADVADRCVITEVVNSIPAMRAWADQLSEAYDELAAVRAQMGGEAVVWQFQDREGIWHNFVDDKHKAATIADGSWPVRPLYTHPSPAVVTEPHPAWRPIESAPKDNKRLLYLARFNPDTGALQEIDLDGIWESDRESWELPQVYHFWASARGIEEPTHWAYQDEAIPAASITPQEPGHE